MTEEIMKDIIANLLFKNGGKNANANYNHVRKFANRIKYENQHTVVDKPVDK